MKKPLEIAWVDLKDGWDRTSGNHQGGINNVNQIDGDSDMASVCFLSGWVEGTQKKDMSPASTSIWKKANSPSLTLMSDSSFLYIPSAFSTIALVLELRMDESV